MKNFCKHKWHIIVGTGIVIIGIAFRLYRIDAPLADWHSFRQTDTAAVARNYVNDSIDLLLPKYEDISNIQSAKDNSSGWRMVEFPLYQAIAAVLTRSFPGVSLEVWLRLISIAASMITSVLLGIIVMRRINIVTGLFTILVWSVLPYSMYYGRTVLPDEFAMCLAIASVLIADISQRRLYLIVVAAIFGALALLVKPAAGFLLLPIIYILFPKGKKWLEDLFLLGIYGFIAGAPFFLWRAWIMQFPEGVPAYSWLFNKDDIRLKGAWFYWLFAERIGNLILGYWGLILLGLGLVVKRQKKEGWLFWWFGAGSLLYMLILAGGNVQHDYYQILILPTLVVFVAKGLSVLVSGEFSKPASIGLTIIVCAFMWAFSWYTIRTYYWINHPEIIEVGKEVDRLLPKDAKIIAPYNGDTTFLYQTKRNGWPIGFSIKDKIILGAQYYVSLGPLESDWETKELAKEYSVYYSDSKFTILNLMQKIQN